MSVFVALALLLSSPSAPPDLFGERAVEEVGGFEMLAPALQCTGKRLKAHVVTADQRGDYKQAMTFLRQQLDACDDKKAIERITAALMKRDPSLDREQALNTATNYVVLFESMLMEPTLRHFQVDVPVAALPFGKLNGEPRGTPATEKSKN